MKNLIKLNCGIKTIRKYKKKELPEIKTIKMVMRTHCDTDLQKCREESGIYRFVNRTIYLAEAQKGGKGKTKIKIEMTTTLAYIV